MTPYEIAHAMRGLLAVGAMIAASGAVAVHAQEQPGNPAGGNIETVGVTLTLIDGSRMIPYPLSDDGQRNFVDVSQIPFNVIDRVDVLKDGASAAYGSDAVAGVVNVVLKKSFTGFNVSAEGGAPGHTGGVTEHLGALGGIGDL